MIEDVSKPNSEDNEAEAVPAGNVRSVVMFLCDHANALSSQGNVEEARKRAQDAWSLVSNDTPYEKALVLCQVGLLNARSRLYGDAERAFLDAIAIYAKLGRVTREMEARGWLSDLYVRMERRAEARMHLERISAYYGQSDDAAGMSMASYFRACIAHLDDRLGDAHKEFQSALQRSERLEGRRGPIGDMKLVGTAAFQTGNFRCAEGIFRAQLDSDGAWRRTATEGVSQFYLGSIALEKNDAETAVVCGKKAVEILSHIKGSHRLYWANGLLAEAYAALGNCDEALSWADRARPGAQLEEGETSTVSWRGIGVALAAAERHMDAEDAFERSIGCSEARQRFEWCRSLLASGRFCLEHGNREAARARLEAAKRKAEAMQAPFYTRKASNLLSSLARLERRAGELTKIRPVEERAAAVSELSADLGRGVELTSFMDRTLVACLMVEGADRAVVVLADAASGALRTAMARSRQSGIGASKRINRGAVRRAMRKKEPLYIRDIGAGNGNGTNKRQGVFDFDVLSVACVPLHHREEGSLGALYLEYRCGGNALSGSEREYLNALAGLLSAGFVQERTRNRLMEPASWGERDVSGRKQLGGLVGASHAMRAVYRLIERAAGTDLSVLIQGETGTGKELAARAIHDNSAVRDRRFLAQNCGTLSGEMIHSELFGHRKGSFTGAVSDRAGLFETAHGGTVFLDEIADAAPQVQTSLLRVLQDGELRRLGESATRRVSVRVIAATNKDLEKAASRGTFRKDLLYRLQVLTISMPALRDRKDDIPLLAAHLLRNAARDAGRDVAGFTSGALRALIRYEWPGNVRQLDNEVRRAVALSEDGGILHAALLSEQVRDAAGEPGEPSSTLKTYLKSVEERYLSQVLERNGWNITRSAVELGLSRSGLYKKLERHGLGASVEAG